MRVTYRHDGIRDALSSSALQRIPGVQATLEPRMTTPQGPAGDQRLSADILVHKLGRHHLGW